MSETSMLGRPFGDHSGMSLAEQVYQQFSHPALAESFISVTCQDGVAVLQGHVPNYEAKQLAEGLAKTVPGVTSVTNAIEIKGGRVS